MWYLTCGISQEVTNVRNYFAESQALRAKPKNDSMHET